MDEMSPIWRSRMLAPFRRRLTFANVTAATALAVALTGGAFAVAAIPAASGTINACFATKTGAIRVVDSAKPKCKKGEKAIGWNQKGPTGASGVAGVAGAPGGPGAQGAKGETGAQGSKGETGEQGIQGIQGGQGLPGTPGTNGTNGSPDTAGQVLTKLSGVDGIGSGLDADLVRGQAPAWSVGTSAGFGEDGATVDFNQLVVIPGLGRLEADCNSEVNQDIRFVSTAGTTLHVMVDTGAGNATLAEDMAPAGTGTAINVTSLSLANPEFQIWRINRAAQQSATVFVEMAPSGSTACQWRTQVVGTT